MRRDSDIGKYFYSLVDDACGAKDKRITVYRNEIKVLIVEDVFFRKGCVLTKTNIVEFNNFVEKDLKKQVNIYLDALCEINDIEIRRAIDFVYDKFDMDETIFPLDTIVKQYYRKRKACKGLSIN
ncbi:MAG: hypothetical protein V4608_03295 [Bacteroidota bacterium]